MANTASARKRARQSENRRAHNASRRSMMRTALKKVLVAIEENNKENAVEAYKAAIPILDSSATHGLIHRNKAARHKSRLSTKIKALS